ncbi:FAD-dependent oxidoreductase [Longimicrobium sp.]|uniref:FAD-dependent oxidoreductase n=1 Tax=Longimicrobium sp. TaxID=2029185 RepID=UPI003B3B52C9
MTSDQDIAFPKLTKAQIDALRPRGRVRNVEAGEVMWSEGERGFGFFVVLEGEMEIVDATGDAPRQVVVHQPGHFSGDVDMLTGRVSLISARMVTDGQVLELDSQALRRVISELAEISEVLLRAFLMRRRLLLGDGFRGIQIIGSRFSPDAHHLREFCSRNDIAYTWIDVEQDPHAEELLCQFHVGVDQTPVVIGRGGELLTSPTVAELARYMGLDARVADGEVFDLVVVGAGPAGLAASVYASSEGLRVLTVEGTAVGGQAGTSSRIENYLGFPTGISGADLARNAQLQAQKFGARISVPQSAVKLGLEGGLRTIKLDDGSRITARCVLVASGAEYRTLDIPGLRELEGNGVYYAATEMEARLCSQVEVVIVGGGNSAGQAAMYLSRYARRVHICIRGKDLGHSMSRYLVDRIDKAGNIQVHKGHVVSSVEGGETLNQVRLRCLEKGEEVAIPSRALFLFIGAVPRTGWLSGCVALDRRGFVLTGETLTPDARDADTWKNVGRTPFFLETSQPGVFAAGDVRAGSVKRVASAVGEGSMSVSFVHAHIGAAV